MNSTQTKSLTLLMHCIYCSSKGPVPGTIPAGLCKGTIDPVFFKVKNCIYSTHCWQNNMIHFDEFENEQSISMISVLVALGSLLLGPLFAGIIIWLFVSIATDPSKNQVFSVFGLAWASTIPFLIWYASKAVKRTHNPHLGTKPFLVFQLTAGLIILLVRFLPETANENSAVADGLRYIFGAVLMVSTTSFIILAKVIRSKLSASTYLGLLFDLIVLLSPV